MARASSPSSPGMWGAGTFLPASTWLAYWRSWRMRHTTHSVTMTPTAADKASSHRPLMKILRSARSMKACTVAVGLATVSTPMTSPLCSTGAPTYMTELRSSCWMSRVERAPYWPRSVSATSRHCE